MPYLAPTAHATLLATLRRERLLPQLGEVLVETRQAVEATDVVARTAVAEHHRLIDVARRLGVPPDKADEAMLKKDGDAVKAGEPIAVRKAALGLRRVAVRSPINGRLVAAAGGKALLAALSRPLELRAGIPGTVVSILQGRGVVIETTGALLEGVWGNGREDNAPLRLLGESPDLALAPGMVEMDMRGAILAVGVITDRAALKQLAGIRVRGLVVGTVAASLISDLRRLDFPVLVVEGFGRAGFSPPALALLANNAGREAWLNAALLDRLRGQQPELIVPLPSPATPPPPPVEGEAVTAGKRVRVLRGPGAGRVGTVMAVGERLAVMPSGLRTRTAQVVFPGDTDAPVRVPLANLELLE